VSLAVFDVPPDIDEDNEDLPMEKLECVITLQFLYLHLFYAENGTFLPRFEDSLAHIAKYVASDEPYAAYVKIAYDYFMQVLEANRNKAAPAGHVDDGTYAARSANVLSAAKDLKAKLRQYR
jgi:hypothetical protein